MNVWRLFSFISEKEKAKSAHPQDGRQAYLLEVSEDILQHPPHLREPQFAAGPRSPQKTIAYRSWQVYPGVKLNPKTHSFFIDSSPLDQGGETCQFVLNVRNAARP